MKITGYRTITTVQHWGHPVGDANGVIEDGITEVPILIIETDGGVEGIGLGAHADIARVFPAIEGEDPRGVSALYDRMIATTFKPGHAGSVYGAIGVADMALWDLKAKLAGEPLWRLLGSRSRFVPGYVSCLDIGVSDEQLPTLYTEWADRGFTGIKIKGGIDIDIDIERLQLAEEIFARNGKRPALMLDVNESWNRKEAVRHVREIENVLDLTWIEEPVRRWDYDGLRAVSAGINAAVASGENLTGIEQFRGLIGRDAVDIVEVGSCWGITHFLRVAILAHAHDLPIAPVGYNADPLAPAAGAVPNHLSLEIQDLKPPVGVRVDRELADGGIILGDAVGSGISLDLAQIDAVRESGNWAKPAGPHVRPERAGLRLSAAGPDRDISAGNIH